MMRATHVRSALPSLLLLAVLAGAGRARAQQTARRPAQEKPLVSAAGKVDWNRYYTAAQNNTIMRTLAARYPRLTELYSIGRSYKGAELMLMEVTSEETGKAADKPALYLDGGIHAGELTGSAVALYTIGYLLEHYGKDSLVTQLLDTRALYVRPKFNPDGSDLVLEHDQRLRSTVRPRDEDGDGTADEDPPEDLDGDGWITQMRVRDAKGDWKLGSDPRIMVRRTPRDSTGPFYFLLSEGIDNDHDGRFNEDGVGGIDMNRNFPRNWEPEYIQDGAGAFSLSEPETYATVKFIVEHPNIASIVHGHTAGGFVYRLPSSSDPATFNVTDLALIEAMGKPYTETTGRPVQASSTDPTDHRYGTLIGWAYDIRGIIGWVPEYVPANAWVTDYNGDGRISDEEAMRFDDEELKGKYFSNWKRFAHPQLGEVEIGGWHTHFWGQNPPAEFLEKECAVQLPWIFSLLQKSPRLELGALHVAGTSGGQVHVEIAVRNTGYLPTNLTERGATGRTGSDGRVTDQIVTPPVAILNVVGGEVVGSARVVVGHLRGSNPFSKAVSDTVRSVSWTVRKTGAVLRVSVTLAPNPGGSPHTGEAVYR